MDPIQAITGWLLIVIVSMAATVYFSHRWGHDPFGWMLLSAAMGPIAMVALVGTRQADAQRSRIAGETHPTAPRGNLVLASDGSEFGSRMARHIAGGPYRGRDVVVLTVLPHELAADQREAGRKSREASDEIMRILRAAGMSASQEIRYGAPGEEIVRYADECQAALLIIGRRGAGLTRAVLGSVSDHVVEHTSRPVLIVS